MKLIRDYIATHIKKEFNDCQESSSAFESESLGRGKQKTSYRLEFASFTPVDYLSGRYVTDEVPVSLILLNSTKKTSTEEYDEIHAKAAAIRSEISNIKNIEGTKIARIEPGAIEHAQYEGNPETIETTINFTFEVKS